MNKFLMGILAGLTILAFTVSASAMSMTFDNWGFNPNGLGNAPADGYVNPIDEMTLLGLTLTNSIPTGAVGNGVGTFTALTTFQSTGFQNNSVVVSVPGTSTYEITGVMNLTGSYARNPVSFLNELTFSTGTMEMYLDNSMDYGNTVSTSTFFGADNGNLIGKFVLDHGTGSMDYLIAKPDGLVDLVWGTDSSLLTAGYWFNQDGFDLTSLSPLQYLTLAITDSNNTYIDTMSEAQIIEFTTDTGMDWSQANDDLRIQTFSSNNGSYVLGTSPVPEPATMLLFGIGLCGIARVGRKNTLKV